MKTLVLVDFDRTLYKKDSLLEFTKFYKGKFNFYIGIVYLSRVLILMKLNLITNEKAKKKYFSYFFKNENYDEFVNLGNQFAKDKIPLHLNRKIISDLQEHLSKNHTIYIVTASFPEWIFNWAVPMNINVIGTMMEVKNNKITGEFTTKNCNGIEKVNRILNEINISDFEKICVYGNGKGDLEMLKLAK